MTPIRLPRLYAIADAETLARRGVGLRAFAEELKAGGVELVQWRAKGPGGGELEPREVLAGAAVLREVFPVGGGCRLVMNDRVDLALIAGFDGVHVGQEDLGVEEVRRVVASNRGLRSETSGAQSSGGFLVGVSTHTAEEVRAADLTSADYVAVGPVFATGSKADAAAVVGLEGVRAARRLTSRPLVAIGGITRGNAAGVFAAGADSVAVISGLFGEGEPLVEVLRGFSRCG